MRAQFLLSLSTIMASYIKFPSMTFTNLILTYCKRRFDGFPIFTVDDFSIYERRSEKPSDCLRQPKSIEREMIKLSTD